jgi:GSH-dependent disulfide-bond oxidoreductase
MLKLYYHPTPNSAKVAVLLEELEAPYEVETIDIMKGEQHTPEFRRVNPNAKVPAIIDDGVTVFDSHAILLYLAEKHRKFLPHERAARAATLSWLEFVATGIVAVFRSGGPLPALRAGKHPLRQEPICQGS